VHYITSHTHTHTHSGADKFRCTAAVTAAWLTAAWPLNHAEACVSVMSWLYSKREGIVFGKGGSGVCCVAIVWRRSRLCACAPVCVFVVFFKICTNMRWVVTYTPRLAERMSHFSFPMTCGEVVAGSRLFPGRAFEFLFPRIVVLLPPLPPRVVSTPLGTASVEHCGREATGGRSGSGHLFLLLYFHK